MLIEVHIIQNHAPSNLNRDDSGSPKSAIFGGYRRARISSQCLKRCYRTSKTFSEEIDTLGMHTRSMPEEIKARLLAHAKTLTADNQKGQKDKFEEWAEKSQATLAAILGKEKAAKAEEGEDEDAVTEAAEATDAEGADEGAVAPGENHGKADKLKTAQSIFWREMELQALFDAYRKRIEWDEHVPEEKRKAFDSKGKVKAQEMLKELSGKSADGFSTAFKRIRDQYNKDSKGLEEKFKAPANEEGDKKEDRERKLKKAKAKNDETAAEAVAQLIVEHLDPKIILKEAGLRPDGIPVDMALFGRMVASPLMQNVEGSSQFAHAISTHEFAREFDLWTRVDDRRDKRLDYYRDAFGAEEKLESGTDGMGDAEFTSACYYSYFNVDFCGLMDNLTGKALKRDLEVPSADMAHARSRACNAVIGLLKAAILERPTGKFNSMATPSLPTLVLVEVRDSHVPVSYADAFAKPVDSKNDETQKDNGQIERVDLPLESAKRLCKETNRITKAFTRTAKKRLRFTGDRDLGVQLERAKGEQDGVNEDVSTIDDLVRKLRAALECEKEKQNA